MTAIDLLDLIGDANECIIEEAKISKQRPFEWTKCASMVACLAFAVIAGIVGALILDSKSYIGIANNHNTGDISNNSMQGTEQWEDIVIINKVVQNSSESGWIDMNPDLYMRNVTLLSMDELMDYYGIDIKISNISDILNMVAEDSFSYIGPSLIYYPDDSFGIYQDGEFIYDENGLYFANKDCSKEFRVMFSKKSNILFPGSRNVTDTVLSKEDYNLSKISGIECIIGRSEFAEDMMEPSYLSFMELGNTNITIVTDGLSEEQVISVLKEFIRLVEE